MTNSAFYVVVSFLVLLTIPNASRALDETKTLQTSGTDKDSAAQLDDPPDVPDRPDPPDQRDPPARPDLQPRGAVGDFFDSAEGKASVSALETLIDSRSPVGRTLVVTDFFEYAQQQQNRFSGRLTGSDLAQAEKDLGFLAPLMSDWDLGLETAAWNKPTIEYSTNLLVDLMDGAVVSATIAQPHLLAVTTVYFMTDSATYVTRSLVTGAVVAYGQISKTTANALVAQYDKTSRQIGKTNRELEALMSLPERDPGAFLRLITHGY